MLQTVWAVWAAGHSCCQRCRRFVHDKTEKKQSLSNKLKKKIVHSGSYQQNAFMTITCTVSRTLGLSLYPKENKHLHYS